MIVGSVCYFLYKSTLFFTWLLSLPTWRKSTPSKVWINSLLILVVNLSPLNFVFSVFSLKTNFLTVLPALLFYIHFLLFCDLSRWARGWVHGNNRQGKAVCKSARKHGDSEDSKHAYLHECVYSCLNRRRRKALRAWRVNQWKARTFTRTTWPSRLITLSFRAMLPGSTTTGRELNLQMSAIYL